ncbi:MAG: hypothetical protein OCC49_11915 [Fibrobacterales bacterium]
MVLFSSHFILLLFLFFVSNLSAQEDVVAHSGPILSAAEVFMLESAGFSQEQIDAGGQKLLVALNEESLDDERDDDADSEEEDDDEDDDDELIIPPIESDGNFSTQSREMLTLQGLTPAQITQYEEMLRAQQDQMQNVEPPKLGPDGNLSESDKEFLRSQGYQDSDIIQYEIQLQMLKVQPVLGDNDSISLSVREALLFQGYSEADIIKIEKTLQKAQGFKPVGSVPLDSARTFTFDYELNPYFTFLGFGKLFTDPTVLEAGEEEGVYGYLGKNFIFPKFVTLQLSVNPFPNIGVYVKKSHTDKDGYDNSWYGPLITSVTAGFPDAGALSLFLGNRVFSGVRETGAITGQGFGGALINYGPLHIVNSKYVRDDWLELESKMKGADLSEMKQISFSFRLGGKIHSHNEINNTLFVSLKRDRTDKDNSDFFSFKNSDQEVRLDVLMDDFLKATQFTFVFGKKIPIFDGEYVLSLSLGALQIRTAGYEGSLRQEVEGTGWTFVFRPNVLF